MELTELNPDKAAYIGIRDILKWKMDHKNSKNVDPSSIIIISFHFNLVKWKLEPTSINKFHLSFWNAHYRENYSIYQMWVNARSDNKMNYEEVKLMMVL